MPWPVFGACLGLIAALACAQTTAHLTVALDDAHFHSLFDLDRSNGLPDLISTFALAAGAAAAWVLARRTQAGRRAVAVLVGALLLALTLADLLHDGAHPWRRFGPLVIALVIATVALLNWIGAGASRRVRGTLVVASCCLAASFLVIGLDRLDHRFERERGDLVAEYQIVVKEGLELIGWSLVALALWDEALRLRGASRPTARASRASAARTRRAA